MFETGCSRGGECSQDVAGEFVASRVCHCCICEAFWDRIRDCFLRLGVAESKIDRWFQFFDGVGNFSTDIEICDQVELVVPTTIVFDQCRDAIDEELAIGVEGDGRFVLLLRRRLKTEKFLGSDEKPEGR